MKLIKGTVFKNLVDGCLYMAEKSGADPVPVKKVTANEDGSYTDCGVTASYPAAKMGILFTVVSVPVPDAASVSIGSGTDRAMYIDGVRIGTGSLVLKDILGTVKGGVIATADAKDDDGKDLFFYSIAEDRFYKISTGWDTYYMVENGNEKFVVFMQNRYPVTLPDGENTKEATAVESRVCFYDGGRLVDESDIHGSTSSLPILYKFRDANDTLTFAIVSDRPLVPAETTDGDRVMIEGEKDGYATAAIFSIPGFCVFNEISFPCRRLDGCLFEKATGNFVFVTDEGIVHSNLGHGARIAGGADVLEAVASHPVPVKLDVPNPSHCSFYFCSAAEDGEVPDVVKISVEKTRDRGYITEIAKI